MQKKQIAVIGLGRLGLPFALLWAKRGFRVTGVEISDSRRDAIKKKAVPDHEEELNALLNDAGDNVMLTEDIDESLLQQNAIFIFVNTKNTEDGKFALDQIESVCTKIGELLRNQSHIPLIVLVSSVTPGSIESEMIPLLEGVSGKKNGEGFHFCYSPVFVALGSLVQDFTVPDFALIGENSKKAGDRLEQLLKQFYSNSVSIVRTNYINAELIKLTLTTFVSTKVSYANMIAELCNKIPGSDVDVVTNTLGLYKRISPKSFKGGMPYGGACFLSYNKVLENVTKEHGVDNRLVNATRSYNDAFVSRLGELVCKYLPSNGTVSIIGVAFKDKTDVIEGSMIFVLIDMLMQRGVKVLVYDSFVFKDTKKEYITRANVVPSLVQSIEQGDVILVASKVPNIEDVLGFIGSSKKSKTLIDPWRLFEEVEIPSNTLYIPLGRGINEDSKNQTHPEHQTQKVWQ